MVVTVELSFLSAAVIVWHEARLMAKDDMLQF